MTTYSWRRYSRHAGYEVSSAGDKRFSALFARLPDGRTIEQAYQLDVKGYRAVSSDWRDGKGKPSLRGHSPEDLQREYLELWKTWANSNRHLVSQLRQLAEDEGGVLTDRFATTQCNQAWALSTILNETYK